MMNLDHCAETPGSPPDGTDGASSTKTLRAQGISGDALSKRARDGAIVRRSRGIYVPPDPSDPWGSGLAAQLLRSGPGAVVGLRSAARLHGLDGFHESAALDTLTANRYHQGAVHVHRTRTLVATDVTEVDGFPVTTLSRTLLDLARVCTPDELEFAVESALRGDDLKRPDLWNEWLLPELWERVRVRRARTGASVLHTVLARRPVGCLPTGSYAETALLQGLRREGVDVVRQCEVLLIDAYGNITARFFVDLAVLSCLTAIEVNGARARRGATMTAGDVDRMNLLSRTFRFHVVAGADAVHRPRWAARRVKELVAAEPLHPADSIVRGRRVRIGATWVHVIDLPG